MKRTDYPTTLILTAALVWSGACISCGSDKDSDSEEGASDEGLTIAWIPKERGNEVFQVGLEGARLKALELSAETDREVEILYTAPESAADIEGQMDSVQEAIHAEVDAIAISCSAPDVSESVDAAVAAGIPTMSWDSDCVRPSGDPSDRFTYFGIDNRATGRTVAQLMAAALEADDSMAPPYRIAILSGVPVATNLQQRVAGVWDELKTMDTCRFNEQDDGSWALDRCWPNSLDPDDATFHIYRDEMEKCENVWDEDACATVYVTVETEGSGETLEEVVERDRDEDGEPDLQAVILTGLWPLFAYDSDAGANGIPAWTAAMEAGTLHTVTYDALQFQIDMGQAGLLDAMLGQKYWGWGYDVVQMVHDRLVDDAEFDPEFTDSGADVACPNNYDDLDRMWSSGDFTQELPTCELLED